MTRFLMYNKLQDCTLTPSTANELYPVENLYSFRRAEQFRFTGNTSENLVIFKGGLSFDSIVIDSHNLTSSATVKIQANASDSWTSPTVDITATVADVISYVWASVQSYDYVRILIEDPTNTAPIRLGIVFLAEAQRFKIRDGFITPYQPLGKAAFRSLDISMPYVDNQTELQTFFDRVAGTIFLSNTRQQFGTSPPFYTILDEDCTSFPPLFGVLTGPVQRTKIQAHDAYDVSIQIEEVN